ncbi:unnamed protein product [Arabidopsis lyrata]|nr:unnamed protein product [Arabidopsis lyrata]
MATSTDYSHNNHGWQQVVYRKCHQKQKPADQTASGGKMVGNKTLTNGSYNVFSALMVASEAEETEKAMASLSGAVAKIDPSYLATSLAEYNLATVVELVMILRSKPDALTTILPMLSGDLVGNCKSYSRQSMDLILQFVEIILLNPEARTILVNRAVRKGEWRIPPSSFEILLRLTFPSSSARVKATKRFEKVYPLLKEVALAPKSATEGKAVEQIFTFSLKLAGEGASGNKRNIGLAKEAVAIAIWSNKKAITEGGANCLLYKEAEKSCKLISRRLSRGSGGLRITSITAVVQAIALAAAGGVAGAALSSFFLLA